ncbi:MAG: helix-turn-helix transcriptional regulator [Eubacteriales bacterium]
MEIHISENLKQYRNKKGNTQDQLADFLGISKQSVSKWERGEGYPDITLLPYIASYYNVTVDKLLGTDEIQKRDAIEKYIIKSRALKNAGDIVADLELWETAYKEYPNEIQVMYYLIVAFANDYKKYADKIIVLGQKILNENSYNIYHYTVIQLLCYTYNSLNDKDNAMKYACMLGDYYTTKDQLLVAILKDEQAVRKCQYNIRNLINLIYRNTCIMTMQGKYTPADSINAYTFVINVFKLVFEHDDFGSYADVLSDLHKRIAECYIDEENIITALDNLEEMLKYSIIVDTHPDIIHTSPMINLIECNHVNVTKKQLENECGLRLKELKNNIFDILHEEPRFVKIISDLEKYANK